MSTRAGTSPLCHGFDTLTCIDIFMGGPNWERHLPCANSCLILVKPFAFTTFAATAMTADHIFQHPRTPLEPRRLHTFKCLLQFNALRLHV